MKNPVWQWFVFHNRMKSIRGKRAVVTGAASGIGRAIALELARHGAELFLLDVDAKQLERTADEARSAGVEVIATRCDLSGRNWPMRAR